MEEKNLKILKKWTAKLYETGNWIEMFRKNKRNSWKIELTNEIDQGRACIQKHEWD